MRSSSMAMYWTPISVRRSRATGCWVAMTWKISSRSCRNSSLIAWSFIRTRSAPARSNCRSAVSASSICDSTRPAMRSSDSRNASSSRVNASLVTWETVAWVSAEPSSDVVLCALVLRSLEELDGRRELDDLAVAVFRVHQHEGRVVRDPARLLHVVRDDHDRVALDQATDQVLDLQRRDGIEGGGRLVHQDHFRVDRDAAGDRQPLLLAARQRGARLPEPVLDLVPQGGVAQAALDRLLDAALLPAQQPGREGDVVTDGHRERDRSLEHHAHPLPELQELPGGDDVLFVQYDAAFGAASRNHVVHPVEHPQERALAAARGPDQCRDALLRDRQADVLQRPELPVPEADL